MSAFILLSLLAGAAPERVGLLIIDREAAAAGPALKQAARAQVQRIAQDAVVEMRVAKRTTACSMETFSTLGFDFEMCGVTMPQTMKKLYVVESSINHGKVELTVAFFDHSDMAALNPYARPAKKVTVDSPATYATVMAQVH